MRNTYKYLAYKIFGPFGPKSQHIHRLQPDVYTDGMIRQGHSGALSMRL